MIKTFLASALLLSSSLSLADQFVFPNKEIPSTATVSRREPTLITVDGHKIKRIYGTEGLFVVTPEADTGAAWFKPMTDAPMFSVFVTDVDGHHFKLLLEVKDVPADAIIIKPPRSIVSPSAVGLRNEPRNVAITAVIQALYNGEGDSKNLVIPLWKGTQFTLLREYELEAVKGQVYRLVNLSAKRMVVDEREFYHERVQAVAIDKLTLEPNDTTLVYVVMESEDE